jgi:CubicO group peptidase (beta-lactamase class C family)
MIALLALLTLAAPQEAAVAMSAAADYSAAHGGLALVVRDARGEVVLERYAKGIGPDSALPLFSAGHGFWAVAALAAEEDGLLELDGSVARWLGAWKGIVAKEEVLVRQLLDMTAGLDPNPKPVRSPQTLDRYAAALGSRMTEKAGARFRFGPSTWMVFGALLGEVGKPRQEDAFAYLQRRVLAPLSIATHEWERDRAGNPMIPFGAYLSAREWTKLGTFLLCEGRVGETQVVSAERIARLSTPCAVKSGYGLGFWLRESLARAQEDDVQAAEDAPAVAPDALAGLPEDVYFSAGLNGQRLYVIPSRGLAIARLALSGDGWSDVEFLRLLLDVPAPAAGGD